jgi:hypothetical protein
MAKKNTAAPSQPSGGTASSLPSYGTASAGRKKNADAPMPPQWGNMGYDIAAPRSGLGSIGMVGSPMQPAYMTGGSNASSNKMRAQGSSVADALRGGTGTVSFPMAHAGGVPGQNSRQGYNAYGVYIDNGPGNYDAQGNYIFDQQVARDAQRARMPGTPSGPPVYVGGALVQPMKRPDGSVYTQPASGAPTPAPTMPSPTMPLADSLTMQQNVINRVGGMYGQAPVDLVAQQAELQRQARLKAEAEAQAQAQAQALRDYEQQMMESIRQWNSAGAMLGGGN